MQTNDLELGGVEWALSGAGRPIGAAAPEVALFALLFCVLVELVLCRLFVTCTPHTCFCACTKSQDKMWHKKGKLSWIEIRGVQTLLY